MRFKVRNSAWQRPAGNSSTVAGHLTFQARLEPSIAPETSPPTVETAHTKQLKNISSKSYTLQIPEPWNPKNLNPQTLKRYKVLMPESPYRTLWNLHRALARNLRNPPEEGALIIRIGSCHGAEYTSKLVVAIIFGPYISSNSKTPKP